MWQMIPDHNVFVLNHSNVKGIRVKPITTRHWYQFQSYALRCISPNAIELIINAMNIDDLILKRFFA